MESGTQGQQTFVQRCCNLGYFRTALGIFKCLELLVVVLGLIFMASVSAVNATAIKFFIVVTTATMIFLFVHIILNVMNLYHRMPLLLIASFTQMILCSLAALLLLICSAITLNKYSEWEVHAGSVLGLIAMGLFILEAIYNFIQHKRGQPKDADQERVGDEKKKDTEQPPSY